MRKMLLLLPLMVLAAGCLENNRGYSVAYDQAESQITVTGKNLDVSNILRKMIAANGWKQESAGTKVHSSNTTKIVSGIKIKKDVTKICDSWMVVRTNDGVALRFDTHTENDKKATIKISADGDSNVDTSTYVSELMGWFGKEKKYARPGHINITIAGLQQDAEDANLFTGAWVAVGGWDADYVEFDIKYGVNGNRATSRFTMHKRDVLPDGQTRLGDAISIQFDRKGGTLAIEADERLSQGTGTAKLRVDPEYLKAISQACSDIGDTVDVDTVLRIFRSNIDSKYAAEISKVFVKPITFKDLQKLSNYHVAVDYVQGFIDAGYDFNVDQLVRLKQYHLKPEYAGQFKKAGFKFDVGELIKLKNYHVDPADAAAFKSAGYDFDVDDLIKARNYHLSPEQAITFTKAGYKFDLAELIKLKNYHVSAGEAAVFKRAGYEFGTRELIKAKNYHVRADYAARLKKAGYDFTIDELVKVKNYNVSIDFMEKVADDEYENFTADELVDMRNKNIRAETILKLRKKKAKPAA